MSKILITGVTGQLGKSVLHTVLKKINASDLAVLVRHASKAEDLKAKGIDIRVGDYLNYDSLLKAFTGIDKLYFVSGSDIATRTLQHENVVKAAKAAGVKHVVYTSFQRKNETESSPIAFVAEAHLKAEKWLIESGMTYTILKHGLYMDMLPMFIGDKLFETGVIYQPAGEGKTAFTLREDLAELGAVVITTKGHENKIYEAVADKAYSYAEISKIITEITGKPIQYVSPTKDEYIKTLSSAGVPMEYVMLFASFADAIKQGEFEQTSSDLETLTGHKPTSLKDYLAQVYSTK
jgi:NAD(P)H dehydrogenase (quinone)